VPRVALRPSGSGDWPQRSPAGDRVVARLTLNQPDYRIKAFRAMMGALRVKPEVLLEVSVPFPRDKMSRDQAARDQAAGEAAS
jgi:hypothetical protein